LPLFSEVGRDMPRWPNAAHFVTWLALCPGNDISGGKLLWRGARKVKNRAGHLFRMAAFSLHRRLTPLGNYRRRMKAKLGPELPPWQPPTRSQLSFTPWSNNKSSMTRPFWDAREAQRKEMVGSETQTASQTTGLRTCPNRTSGRITNEFSTRLFLGNFRLADDRVD